MAQQPVQHHVPDRGTDDSGRMRAPAHPSLLPRIIPVFLIVIGAAAGTILGLQYSGRVPGEGSGLPLAEQLLHMALPPQEEAGILFGSNDEKPASNPDLLPAGLPLVYAFYEAPGRKTAGQPQVTWTKDGKPLPAPATADVTANSGGSAGRIVLRPPGGKLVPGVYEVEVALGASHIAASFVAAAGADQIMTQSAPAEGQVTISDLTLANAVSSQSEPQGPKRSFDGRDRIFVAFKFAKAEPGSAIVVKWFGGSELVKAATKEIVLPSTQGTASAWLQAPPGSPLPVGQYSVTISMAGDTAALAQATFNVKAATPLTATNRKGGALGSALSR